MNPLKALLTRLFQTTPIQDHDDPVLGVLRWRPSTESWVSGPLPPDRRFHLEIARHKNGRAPPDDCVQVARDIAKDPVKLERGVRTQLVYEAQRRPPELRARIIELTAQRVTLHSDGEKVYGEVLLHGDPALSNWSVWHVNGVPSQVAQHWE